MPKIKPPNGIAITAAKIELQRINEFLAEPELLIGGIAVNNYVKTRRTADIDLVCSDDVVVELIDALYPSDRWSQSLGGNEERPTYHLTDTKNISGHGVVFGPKILERGGYQLLDWDDLYARAQPLVVHNTDKPNVAVVLENILVPSVEDLIYTKIISFFGRNPDRAAKRQQDLKDIVALSNCDLNMRNLVNFLEVMSEKNKKDIIFEFLRGIQTQEETAILEPSWFFKNLILNFVTQAPKENDIDYDYAEKTAILSSNLELLINRIVDPATIYALLRTPRSADILAASVDLIQEAPSEDFLTPNYIDFEVDEVGEAEFSQIVQASTYRATDVAEGEGVGLARSSLYIDLHSAATNMDKRSVMAKNLWDFLKCLGAKNAIQLVNFTLAAPRQGNIPLAVEVQRLSRAELIMVRTDPQVPKFGLPIEGELAKTRPVIIIDDLCMDAHFLIRAVKRIRAEGAEVKSVVTLLERNDAVGGAKLAEIGVTLHSKYTVNASVFSTRFPRRMSA